MSFILTRKLLNHLASNSSMQISFITFSVIFSFSKLRNPVQCSIDSRYLEYSRILDISNNLSGSLIINPLIKQKESSWYLESRYLNIMKFFRKFLKQIFRSLEQFSLVVLDFSQHFRNFSCNFFSQISLFSTPSSTIAALLPARMSKDSQIIFFCSFFWSNVFTRSFYH